jgi:hypothetical protein
VDPVRDSFTSQKICGLQATESFFFVTLRNSVRNGCGVHPFFLERRTRRYLPEGRTWGATVYTGIFILTALSPTHTSIAWVRGDVYLDGSGNHPLFCQMRIRKYLLRRALGPIRVYSKWVRGFWGQPLLCQIGWRESSPEKRLDPSIFLLNGYAGLFTRKARAHKFFL